MKLFPRVKIKKELENALHFISYLLSLSFNSNDNLHNTFFNSIKLFFIDNANSYKKETLSIFSLLLMLSMYQLYPSYMLKIFTLAKRHIVSLFDKVTSICSDIYESEKMLRFYNTNNNVIDTLNDFVLGVIDIVQKVFLLLKISKTQNIHCGKRLRKLITELKETHQVQLCGKQNLSKKNIRKMLIQ